MNEYYVNGTTIKEDELIPIEELQSLQRHLHISNTELGIHEKWIALKQAGLSDQEADRLCTPNEPTHEQVMREVGELSKAHQRELRREHLKEQRQRKGEQIQSVPLDLTSDLRHLLGGVTHLK